MCATLLSKSSALPVSDRRFVVTTSVFFLYDLSQDGAPILIAPSTIAAGKVKDCKIWYSRRRFLNPNSKSERILASGELKLRKLRIVQLER